MHQQSLTLLHPTVKEKMHLQENTLFDADFDLGLGVKVTHLGVKVTQNNAQYPLQHVTYSATKFEVAMSKGLGGDAFTRKFNI